MLLLLTIIRESLAISVMQIFSDRLHVAHCRAGCMAMLDMQEVTEEKREEVLDEQERCWSVCGMLGSDTPTWAQVCNKQVCGGACQVACKMFFTLPTSLTSNNHNMFSVEPMLSGCSVVWDLVPGYVGTRVVFLVVGRDRAGRWSEVDQIMGSRVRISDTFEEVIVMVVERAGVVDIRFVAMDQDDENCENISKDSNKKDPWEVVLDKIVPDGSIYQVHLHWMEKNVSVEEEQSENLPFRPEAKYAVHWEIGSVAGVILTNMSVAKIPLPPHSTITAKVSLIDTSLASSPITVSTPALPPTTSLTTAYGITFGISIIAILALSFFLFIVMNLYKRVHNIDKESLSSCQSTRSTSCTSIATDVHNMSLVTFENFLTKHKISNISCEQKRNSISVDLYVL